MLIKKLGSLLVAMSLAAACIPGTLASAAEAAWFDIEAEKNLSKASGHIETTEASGGSYLMANDDHQGLYSTNTFTLEAAGTYDIYAVIGVDSSDYIGGYTFTIDEDEFYSKSTNIANADAVSESLYTSAALTGGAHNKPMKWVRIASGKTISNGEHTLKAAVTKAAETNNQMGCIDVIRFVPTEWSWVPSNNLDEPTDMTPVVKTNKDLILEAENATFSGYSVVTNSAASNGKLLDKGATLSEVGTSVAMGDDYKISMSFKTEAASDDYEIWALTSGTGGHTSQFDYALDGAALGKGSANATTVYKQANAGFPGYSHSMQWRKVGVVNMTAGRHQLVLTTTTSAQFAGRILGAIDSVRIVPIGMDFDKASVNAQVSVSEWFHIEAEDGADSDAEIVRNAFTWASNTAVIRTGFSKMTGKGQATFGVRNAGKFDVYAVIAFGDKTYGSPDNVQYTFTFNGSDTPFYQMKQQSIVAANDEAFTTNLGLNSGVAFDVKWVKIGEEIELSGKTVLDYQLDGHGVIDCIRVVPSEWNWVPTGANFDVPTNSPIAYTAINAMFSGNAAYALVQDAKAVGTDPVDVAVIFAIYNADGSLYGVWAEEKTLTSEAQNVTVMPTLPSDFSGAGKTGTVFIWSDLDAGIAYTDPVSIVGAVE